MLPLARYSKLVFVAMTCKLHRLLESSVRLLKTVPLRRALSLEPMTTLEHENKGAKVELLGSLIT